MPTSTSQSNTQSYIQSLAKCALPLKSSHDLQRIIDDIPDSARVVLIGEASHGTADFYALRAELTKKLITQKGFNAVAVESDWPDALAVNKYWTGHKKSAEHALGEYKRRWPQWMWRNTVVEHFVDWLKDHNAQFSDPKEFVNWYGLDLYSLQSSRDAVVNYLEKEDPKLAEMARKSYGCLDRFGDSEQSYAYSMSLGLTKPCEESVLRVLKEMLQHQGELVKDAKEGDEYFYALQNAKLVKDAEKYYRHMFSSNVSTWNIRDEHMADCLCDLMEYKTKTEGRPAKVVVWAHNSHLSGVSLTKGEWNLGELVRKRFPGQKHYIVGFTTHTGTVSAGDSWDAPVQCKRVNPSMPNSVERLMHDVVKEAADNLPHRRFALLLDKLDTPLQKFLSETRIERAIGVIYVQDPQREYYSHYCKVNLMDQFNALIHVDHSHALVPLDKEPQWIRQKDKHHQHLGDDVPETFPFGL